MSTFSPLVVCVVYVCIVSLSTSVSWRARARDLGSVGVGLINKEDSQHTKFQDLSKSSERMKVDMSTRMPPGTNDSTMIMKQEDRMTSKLEQGRIINDTNLKTQLDDHHQNDDEHKELGKRIRAQSRDENEAKVPPCPNPKGKGSRRLAKRKRKLPQAMVSWRVPRKKKKKGEHQQQEEQPDFDLDYAPPKVHPPTHN